MTEPSATEASNAFWIEFKSARQAIEVQIARSTTLSKTALPQHFQAILQAINDLEKRLTKATEFIPSYDERQYSRQIKELNAALEDAKSSLLPKPRFTFKSRKTKNTPTKATAATAVETTLAPAVNHEEKSMDGAVSFRGISDRVLSITEKTTEPLVDVLLFNLTRCVILLDDNNIQVSALHMKNLSECVVICPAVQGSVLMYGLNRSFLVLGCHQFRMHDAQDVDILLQVSSRPIMEDSTDIRVGPLKTEKQAANLYDQMDDFNWLKKQASPNWRVMSEEETNRFHESTEDAKQQTNKSALTFLRSLLYH